MKKQKPVWAVAFGLILVAYTVYVMMDVFVIKRPMQENATGMNLALFENQGTPTPVATPSQVESPTPIVPTPTQDKPVTQAPTATPTVTPTPTPSYFSEEIIETDSFYSNDHLSVTMTEIREHDTQIHIAEVRVSSAQYILSAFAKDTYGRHYKQKVSVMAKNNEAVFAINGDNYGEREGGYVIKNGILYRKQGNANMELLCIMPDGDFIFSHSKNATAQEILDMGTWQGLTFGPVLLDDGEIKVGKNQEVALCYPTNPRTVIGMVEPLHYFFVVADGRTSKSHGLSLYECADLMKRLGCTKAFNLDGGGSSVMVFRGKVVNFPTTDGSYLEREVTDIVYVR